MALHGAGDHPLDAADSALISALLDSLQDGSGVGGDAHVLAPLDLHTAAVSPAVAVPASLSQSAHHAAQQVEPHALAAGVPLPLPPALDGGEAEQLLDALYAPMLALGGRFPAVGGDALDLSLGSATTQPSSSTGRGFEQNGALRTQVDGQTQRRGENARDEPGRGGKRGGARKTEGRRQRQSNPNKAREERNLELIFLRGKVSEMEQQLATLRASRSSSDEGDQPSPPTDQPRVRALPSDSLIGHEEEAESAEDASCLRLTDTWKQLCLRQLQRRIKAERENTRLKRALEGQLKVSNMIQRLLDRPAGINDIELPSRKRARSMGVPSTDPEVDRAIFSHLLTEADASLREIDVVLEENGIFNVETAHRGAKMRERGGGLYLDVFATSVLPFDFTYTGSGVWKHYKGTQKHFGSVYEKTTQYVGPNDDTIMENFAMEMTSSSTRADFRLRQVVKRSVTPERVVIVWTTDGEPIEYMNKMTNFGFHERGYVVCRPPSERRDGTSSEPSTVLQVCHRISPYESTHSAPSTTPTPTTLTTVGNVSSANIGGVAQFVFSSLDLELKANQEHIENLLLDETASSSSTSGGSQQQAAPQPAGAP